MGTPPPGAPGYSRLERREEGPARGRRGGPASLPVGSIASRGVIVVGFTYLFGLDNTLVHTFMVGALAAVIALSLFTVGALDYPFGWGVTPGTAVSTTAMHAPSPRPSHRQQERSCSSPPTFLVRGGGERTPHIIRHVCSASILRSRQ